MAGIFSYNGSSWVKNSIKGHNGSGWTDAKVHAHNGSAWVQIYPDTVANTTKTITVSSGMAYFRPKWGSWESGEARQGDGSSYGASNDNTGCLNLSSSGFTGTGNITSISEATFTGKRGGAGTYNSNQTIRFYRSNVSAGSGDPRSSLAGSFTSTTGGPGSGKTMSNRSISASQSGLKDWMNGVSGKKILYIRSNSSSEYLNIEPSFSVTAKYTYNAKMLTFVKDDDIMLLNKSKSIKPIREINENEIYHKMLVYPEEVNMSLKEIIRNRTENNLPDIKKDSLIDLSEHKPYYLSYEIDKDNNFNIDIYNTKENHKCEICYNGHDFEILNPSDKGNHYKHPLHKDFNKYKDNIIIRVINTQIDKIDMELIIEPDILIL